VVGDDASGRFTGVRFPFPTGEKEGFLPAERTNGGSKRVKAEGKEEYRNAGAAGGAWSVWAGTERLMVGE